MKAYMDFIFKSGREECSDHASVPVFIVPKAIGGKHQVDNRLFLSEGDWIEAQTLAMRFFAELDIRRPERSHARYVLSVLSKLNASECASEVLRRFCRSALNYAGGELRPATLFRTDGRIVNGTYAELVAQTGLDYDRVRDLVKGRRRYCSGWCASQKEAARGKLRPGRKPKRLELATEGVKLF